jgi:hypothetical protein
MTTHSISGATGGAAHVATGKSLRTVGTLERLPKWLNLVPMVTQWIWLSIRYRSVTLPSTINPAILTGGMVGEGKVDYFDTMGPHALSCVATYTAILNRGVFGLPEAQAAIAAAGLAFPLIAKPDIGWCGFGVRLLRNVEELQQYLAAFPLNERIVFQKYLTYPGEAGIYYVREPGAAHGKVTGILLRYFPRVCGDGRRTVAELMAADPRLLRLGRDGLSEPCCDVGNIPAAGDIVRVATIGSTRVGGLYEDGTSMLTQTLGDSIDAIARDMQDFHVGRFDVRYETLSALLDGKEFGIIEVNGAGSEAVHAWDPKFSLREAYAIVFAKQRMLFAIGDSMRRLGHKPAGVIRLAKLYMRQQRLIRQYPKSN